MEDPESVNKFSCNECKRRRIRCSREIPQCGPCSKFKRHCLYEKPFKSPLTRKHLTEVEEELGLMKKIFVKYFPDVDLTLVIQQLKNGADITSIPEFDIYPEKTDKKKRKVSESYVLTPSANGMAIESLLVPTEQNRVQEDNHIHQVPQLLPPTVNENQTAENDQKNFSGSDSLDRKYTWDERKRSEFDRRPSIIDGMATTHQNGYLGTASSAALINMVTSGFFFHSKTKKNRPVTDDCSPTSSVSSVSKEIPSKQVIENYVYSYFETYHVSYPIIHKPLFLAQLNEIVPPPSYGWESLMYIVAAIGAFMSATNAEDNDDLRLFELAKKHLSIEDLETGNLALVQTLSLMSNYLQKRDRPNSGYNYLGLAVRMALGLGIHKNFEESEESQLNQEMGRRTWWCLYIFDCGQTITYGRPLGIPCAGIDARLPRNIVDSSLTASTFGMPKEEEGATIYTSVRLQSLFHLYTNSIYERIISDPFPLAKDLLSWDNNYIERWKSQIPDYFAHDVKVPSQFKLAHSVLHWRCSNLRILMYRTFLLKRVIVNPKLFYPDDFETQAGKICLEECRATIQSMNDFWNEKQVFIRMDAWYSLFFLISAVLMPLVCLRNDPQSPELDGWVQDVLTAQSIIEKISVICPPATKISDLINTLGAGFLTTSVEQDMLNEQPVESPLSQLMQLHSMLWPGSFDIEQQFL